MKLIIIHGPPAAGKLTIANALATRTGLKVFHNHLTIDCTKPVFEFGTPEFWDVNVKLRCWIIAEAAKRGIDIVHTCCYSMGVDDEYFRAIAAAATNNGGEVDVVLINCRDDVRRERIADGSRVRLEKLTNPDWVYRQRQEALLFSPHPDFADETLRIDTSDISPDDAAMLIIKRFDLRKEPS